MAIRAVERCPSWPKEHDWKSCIRQKRIWGSNPHLSARNFIAPFFRTALFRLRRCDAARERCTPSDRSIGRRVPKYASSLFHGHMTHPAPARCFVPIPQFFILMLLRPLEPVIIYFRAIRIMRHPYGGVAEWLNAAVSKTVLPVTRVTRVRIPPPPPAGQSGPRKRGSFHIQGSYGNSNR